MKLRALRRMGVSGLAYRGWQEISKSLERLGTAPASSNGHHLPHVLGRLTPHPALREAGALACAGGCDGAAEELLDCFRATAAARFFEGAGNGQSPVFLPASMSRDCDRVIADADAACRGRFGLMGYGGLFFGDPVDWHLDPSTGRRSPLVHWSRIDPLEAKTVGDSKVVWELNRHQWIVALGLAYRLTGEDRYAEVFAARVREWMRANPPGMGVNWTSSLEAALRLIAWCWALFLFRGAEALAPALFAEMLGCIWEHASRVERYLSYCFSPNTHLTGEALGLFYAGVVFPEFREAHRWRARGAAILTEQMERQVLPDGVYFEQSTCYQRYTTEIYLHFLILAARNGWRVPSALGGRVQRLLDFLLAVGQPGDSMPQIGDSDGGWLLPLCRRPPGDFRGVFSVAAALFGRSDYAWMAGELAPETIWLLGNKGCEAFEAARPASPPGTPFRVFPQGGYVVMRSGWERRAHHLILDAGPLGCPVSGGHGHADLLSIQCTAFGDPYLVDPGTYCYTKSPEWRDHFRSTAAHSTVMVDGLSQAAPAGPFAWQKQKRPRARLRRWVSAETFDLADADHDAYRFLPDPVTHRRRVVFAKPRYWVVVDDLEGKAEHRIEVRFQFAPLRVTLGPGGWARAQGPAGCGLLLRSFAAAELRADLFEGDLHPPRGWVSPDYGQRRPAPLLVYSAAAQLPFRVVTLLLPVERPGEPAPAIAPLAAGGFELAFEDRRETVWIGDRDIAIARG